MVFRKNVNGKMLRCGYTTGSCAAAAAKAGAILLFLGTPVSNVTLNTPKGISLTLDVLTIELKDGQAVCAVRKDSGDDPDVTNGILIYAAVSKMEASRNSVSRSVSEMKASTGMKKTFPESENTFPVDGKTNHDIPFLNETNLNDPVIIIEGGEGIGIVTRPGLNQPVGAFAINSVPRKMITEAVSEICRQYGYSGSLRVVISIPGGSELAKRTFNSRIGIEGGLSIIGTTGILEPMSNQALIDTIRLEIGQLAASGHKRILLTPGNYGADFARKQLGLNLTNHILCSNFIGDAIDCCVEQGFTEIFLVGHIGKLVKLGIGITNTHSSFGDGRMETLIACALKAGGDLKLLHILLDCLTTDEVLLKLKAAGILNNAMQILGTRIQDCLSRKTPEHVQIEFLCFTNEKTLPCPLCESPGAKAFIRSIERDTEVNG